MPAFRQRERAGQWRRRWALFWARGPTRPAVAGAP
jgi:hypothetical protein